MTALHAGAGAPAPHHEAVAPLRRPPAPHGATTTRSRFAAPEPAGAAGHLDSVQGALALDLAPAGPPPPSLSVVHLRRHQDPDPETVAQVETWAGRFAQAVVEVTGGDRPVTQLLRWTAPRVYQDLDRRVRVLAQTRTGQARTRAVRPQVRSVHVFLPGPRTAEISVHVRYGQRSRALAARLELHRGRWTCTALQLG